MDAKEELGLATGNMTYTTLQAVLMIFKRRLSVDQSISFAGELPIVLKAICVSEWDPTEERLPFAELTAMNEEVKHLQQHHNFSPDNSIQLVAKALRRHVDERQLERVLKQISPQACDYWLHTPSPND